MKTPICNLESYTYLSSAKASAFACYLMIMPGDVAVIPGGVEHEAFFPEDTEVVDFFAPVREDFLSGEVPSYMAQR